MGGFDSLPAGARRQRRLLHLQNLWTRHHERRLRFHRKSAATRDSRVPVLDF